MNMHYCKRWLALPGLALIAAQAILMPTPAAAADENQGRLSAADYKFAQEAARGGTMEANLGKIAAQRSSNPAVQQFGHRMVTDHGQAGQELAQIAASKGALLPVELKPGQQREMDRLARLSGPVFDQAYMKLMVRDHKEDVKEFKRASEDAQDPDLKAFAAKTLTVIQEHLTMAEDLDKDIRHEISANR